LLRLHHRFGREINVSAAETVTTQLMQTLEQQLSKSDWLVGTSATVADIAIYPYIALAPEARIDLVPYPAINAWLARVQALPGYIGMPGMAASVQ